MLGKRSATSWSLWFFCCFARDVNRLTPTYPVRARVRILSTFVPVRVMLKAVESSLWITDVCFFSKISPHFFQFYFQIANFLTSVASVSIPYASFCTYLLVPAGRLPLWDLSRWTSRPSRFLSLIVLTTHGTLELHRATVPCTLSVWQVLREC